ncbi:MAG: hypothetical protein Q9157_004937 [Trypethelium eluteriae]
MAGNSTAPKRTTDHTSESRTNSKRPRPTSTPTQFHTGNSTHSSHHLNSTSTRGSSSLNRTSSATNLPQVVINSTTYDVGYGSETITRASGSPIVLESGGIVVGSSSVPFPSSTASSTDQASKGITIGGVPITVETPSPTHFENPAAVTDVIINGETYLLPQSRVELPREDGSTLVLEPSAVVIDLQTFPVPPVSESTSLTASGSAGSSGSNTIVAQPGPTKKPSTGGLLGFAGLLHALGGIASDAREASSSINKVMDEGAKWAAGNMENGDSGFASAIDDALNTGTARLRSTRSSLSGLGENLGTELDSLTPGGKRVFQGVDKSCSGTFDWLQTVGDLVKRLPKLVGKNRKIVDNTLRLIFKNAKNHPLVTGNMALAAFEVYQWSKEPKDGPVPPAQSATTATSTNTTESATKTRSSSTSTTTTSDPTRIPYIISAKWDAPPGKFQDFVKTLPEPGSHTAEDGLLNHGEPFWDLYFTKLSRKEAAEVRQHDFIETAISGYETNVNFQKFNVLTNMDKPSNRSLDKRSNNPTPDQNLYTRLPHYSHLQLISQPTKDHPPGNNPYLFDPSLGYQSSIYVLDGGCDRNHKELQVGERGGGPDSVTGWPENEWFHDIDGHGTMVSSVAAGIDLGVASKANIICVQAFLSTQPPTPEQRQLFLQRMRQAFSWTRTEIDRKRNWNSAVINLSGGETLRRDRNTGQVIPEDVPLNEYYQEMLRWCDARGVPFVLAAGNYGNAWYDGTSAVGQFGSADPPPPNTVPYTMQWLTPQSISQSYRSVITVGGVNNNGSLWPYTTPYISRQRQFGYIDTYAQADSVTVALAGTQDTRPIPGTSFATGAVSGLVAYFLGIGRIRQGWLVPSNLPQGQGPQQILDLRAIKSSLSQPAPLSTQKYAYERTSYPFVNFNPQNLNYHALGGFPDILPVVYNDAWTGWCERGRPLPPPRMIKRLKGRANPSPQDSGDQPVVVNGQVVATDVINLVLRSACSSFTSLLNQNVVLLSCQLKSTRLCWGSLGFCKLDFIKLYWESPWFYELCSIRL